MAKKHPQPHAEVGRRIQALRKELEPAEGRRFVRQQDLADRLKVAHGTVTAWEGGYQLPEGKNLVNLAKALGVTPRRILHGLDVETRPNDAEAAAPPVDDGDVDDVPLLAADALDECLRDRVRLIDKLADLLEKDRPILQRRADAAWNVTEVARIETERASTRVSPEPNPTELTRLYELVESLVARLPPDGGGDAGQQHGVSGQHD